MIQVSKILKIKLQQNNYTKQCINFLHPRFQIQNLLFHRTSVQFVQFLFRVVLRTSTYLHTYIVCILKVRIENFELRIENENEYE